MSNKCREVTKEWNHRVSQTVIAVELGVSQSTVSRNLKLEGYLHIRIRPTPKLTEENIKIRNAFVRAVLGDSPDVRHRAWLDTVDIDEKILKLAGYTGTLLYHPDDAPKDKTKPGPNINPKCQSKRFIPGIMVTAAVCRPEFCKNGKLEKIWPSWNLALLG